VAFLGQLRIAELVQLLTERSAWITILSTASFLSVPEPLACPRRGAFQSLCVFTFQNMRPDRDWGVFGSAPVMVWIHPMQRHDCCFLLFIVAPVLVLNVRPSMLGVVLASNRLPVVFSMQSARLMLLVVDRQTDTNSLDDVNIVRKLIDVCVTYQ
jgi:hypothetical protein